MLYSDEHHKLYGYNFKNIAFLIKEDKVCQSKWLRRMHEIHDFTEKLIPEDTLIEESKTLILYSEMGERDLKIPVFSRPTIG